jgi:FAD/FMN-containing dehydrogenase
VPISSLPILLRDAAAACAAGSPGIRVVPFGHFGDGNIHFNLIQPKEAEAGWFLAQSDSLRLMRGIKAAHDPAGLFNPGVIFPPG